MLHNIPDGLAVILIKPLLTYALAFAAGAMIYVVVEELIPESQLEKTPISLPWVPWPVLQS